MTTRTRLLILAAPALSAVLVAQQNVPSVRNPLGGDSAVVAEGQSLFNQVCQSCHGPAGQGSDRGPVLARTALIHGNTDADVFRAIRAGVPGTQMPPFAGLTRHADLAARQLYSQPAGPGSGAGADGADGGDAAAGEALFFGRAGCATCHEVNGRGGVVGPDLSNAGTALARAAAAEDRRSEQPAARRGRRGGAAGAAPPRRQPSS